MEIHGVSLRKMIWIAPMGAGCLATFLVHRQGEWEMYGWSRYYLFNFKTKCVV